ncbi:MAG: hypothetical protein ACK2T4_01700 [Candidatus Promineifilaceae bacterium]|jgi:hypothetical protein
MSEDNSPDIEEIKEQIEIEIDEDVEQLKADEKASKRPDLVAEFQSLGRSFAEAFESAWNSEERKRVEDEVRAGVQTFADEVDKVIREAKKSPTGERVAKEAEEMASKVESSDFGRRALEGLAQGLSWMSIEMGRLSEQFRPEEKSPEESEE